MQYAEKPGRRYARLPSNRKPGRIKAITLVLIVLSSLFGLLTSVQSVSAASWLSGWNYRKSHLINPASGAGTNYQIKLTTYYDSRLSAINNNSAAISTSGYAAENIVYDSDTSKYWWIFTDGTAYPATQTIKLAYASDINGSWSVQPTPVIEEVGHFVETPMLVKFDNYWYIYYGRSSNIGGSYNYTVSIYVQKSSYVNQSYSSAGISNPILDYGSPNEWDGAWVYEPYVARVNNTYYLFYAGFNTSVIRKTGYATSSSPTSGFTKYSGNPVLPADGYPHSWDTGKTQAVDPFVFQIGSTYWIGVTASITENVQPWSIGFYYTNNFVTFRHYSGNPILGPGSSGNWDDKAVLRGAVSEFNGVYYLAYTGYSDLSSFRMGKTVLTVSNTSNNAEVYLDGKCRYDFGDIRFTDDDGITLLDYWMESKVDGYKAVFWVEVADDLSLAPQTIYIYYGNSNATTTSNGANTFQLFDHFDDGSLNPLLWKTIGYSGVAIESGTSLIAAASVIELVYSVPTFGLNTRVRASGFLYLVKPSAVSYVGYASIDGLNAVIAASYYSTSNPYFYIATTSAGVSSYSNTSLLRDNVYHIFDVMRVSSTSSKIYVDSRYAAESTTNNPTAKLPIQFLAFKQALTVIDWVFVSKLVNPEPAHSTWGSEEQPVF